MKRSTDRILTTHMGSLPRPDLLADAVRQLAADRGLALPADQLRASARTADAQIARQVENSEEIGSIVRMLEEQYDSYLSAHEQDMPTAEELGAQFERFLAEQDQRGDNPDH